MPDQKTLYSFVPHGNSLLMMQRCGHLSLVLMLTGCAWVTPSQWFGNDDRCDPNDRSGGLSAACAKESNAPKKRASQRMVCIGDDKNEGWLCGNNMGEIPALIGKQNTTVSDKNESLSPLETRVPDVKELRPPASMKQSRAEAYDSTPSPSIPQDAPGSSETLLTNKQEKDEVSESSLSIEEKTFSDVWVLGSFRERSRALKYAVELERALDRKTHLLQRHHREGADLRYRVVIERPESLSERALLREAIELIGLESPWRLTAGPD